MRCSMTEHGGKSYFDFKVHEKKNPSQGNAPGARKAKEAGERYLGVWKREGSCLRVKYV